MKSGFYYTTHTSKSSNRNVFCTLRFNCGTGAAQIVSESRIVLGQWHTVTVFRDGMSGWLRMDNDTPISGRSQVRAVHRH